VTTRQERDIRARIRPGATIKSLRQRRGWSLAEVSRRTGLSVSSLSKVESGRMDFTLDKLRRLSMALETDIAQLIAPEGARPVHGEPGGRRSVTRSGEGKVIETASGRYRYLADDLLNTRSVPMVIEVTARSLEEFGGLNHHPGEEFLFVLGGRLDLYTSAYLPVHLRTRDAMYFDGNMGHAYVAIGNEPCRVLSVCIAPRVEAILRPFQSKHMGGHESPAASADSPGAGARRQRT
jgi:transcriptional regulator with XRE-family HTH domain